MLNVYGPTEATVNTTLAVLEPGRPVTIGHGIEGYDTLVLDADMRPVPRGEKGELYVGGPGVARGYLNQPELTAKSFIEHAGRRLYRTGDLVRFNDEGELEFFGRIDSQVKIRGFRVELAEIEAVLLEQAQVASAAVRLFERDGVPSLAAYVVLGEAAGELDRGQVLDVLRSRLPAYMVPAFLDVLEAPPMLASGKVDRKNLPGARGSAGVGGGSLASPRRSERRRDRADLGRTVQDGQDRRGAGLLPLDLGGHSCWQRSWSPAAHARRRQRGGARHLRPPDRAEAGGACHPGARGKAHWRCQGGAQGSRGRTRVRAAQAPAGAPRCSRSSTRWP